MKAYFVAIYIFNFNFFYITCIESSLVSKIRYLFDKSAKNNRSNLTVTNTTQYYLRISDKELANFINSSDLEVIHNLSTVSLLATKATTEILLTEEPLYNDWDGQYPENTFEEKGIMAQTSSTVRTTSKKLKLVILKDIIKKFFKDKDPSLLESKIYQEIHKNEQMNYLGHYSKSPKKILTKFSIKNFRRTTFVTEKNTYTTHSHKTQKSTKPSMDYNVSVHRPVFPLFRKELKHLPRDPNNTLHVDREMQSPPWMRYKPMQMRDETGNKIFLDEDLLDIQELYVYPQSRERWWWEYGKHYMHWYFWHCKYWMVHWKKNPPGTDKSIINLNNLVIQDYENYIKSRENLYSHFCTWLLSSEKTNAREMRFNSVIDGLFRSEENQVPSTTPPTEPTTKDKLRQKIYKNDYRVGDCFYCGRLEIERVRPTRICHRAFTDVKYAKFVHWLKARCMFRPEFNTEYSRSEVYSEDGYTFLYGRFYTDMCITHFTDIGELYTDRGCRRMTVSKHTTATVYIQSTYDALDKSLFKTNETTCAVSPYSQFIPFTRAKSGLFVRAYACICSGDFCNSCCRLFDFNEMPRFIILFILTLYVHFRE